VPSGSSTRRKRNKDSIKELKQIKHDIGIIATGLDALNGFVSMTIERMAALKTLLVSKGLITDEEYSEALVNISKSRTKGMPIQPKKIGANEDSIGDG
jgi:hypothetical protein